MSDINIKDLKLEPITANDLDVDGDGQVTVNDIKHIYRSRTVWVNLIMIVALIVQAKLGYIIDPTTQAYALGLINIILRHFTSTPLTWKKP